MTRDDALEELKIRLTDKHVFRRSIAVEAIMAELARHYNADTNIWGLTGLLHDIDYEKTKNNISSHGSVGADILDNLDVDQSIVYSVRAHNDLNGIPRKRKMDKALYLADIVAESILQYSITFNKIPSHIEPEHFLSEIKDEGGHLPEGCKDIELSLEEFVRISLEAIKNSQYCRELFE